MVWSLSVYFETLDRFHFDSLCYSLYFQSLLYSLYLKYSNHSVFAVSNGQKSHSLRHCHPQLVSFHLVASVHLNCLSMILMLWYSIALKHAVEVGAVEVMEPEDVAHGLPFLDLLS